MQYSWLYWAHTFLNMATEFYFSDTVPLIPIIHLGNDRNPICILKVPNMDDKCLQVCILLVYTWNIYKSPHGKTWLVKHFCEEDEASNWGCYIRRKFVNCSSHLILQYLNPEDGSNITVSEIFCHPPRSDSVIQILYFSHLPLINDVKKAYKINR